MEWEQIVDKWAAMARRLRSDRAEGARHVVGDEILRRPEGTERKTLHEIAPRTIGNDGRLPSSH